VRSRDNSRSRSDEEEPADARRRIAAWPTRSPA
jgi:hypothetical protein